MSTTPTPATTDIADAQGDAVQVAAPVFRHYGGRQRFAGPIRVLKVFEDNTLVREWLEEPGEGAVLVIDGGGSARCALVGGNLGQLGVDNGWAGIVVYGQVRDSAELGAQDIGVMALGTHPRKSVKRGVGERDLPVRFADLRLRPGQWLYADEDGIVVAEEAVSL